MDTWQFQLEPQRIAVSRILFVLAYREAEMPFTQNDPSTTTRPWGALPSMIDIHTKLGSLTWARQIGAAKASWSRLTDDELANADGSMQQLAALVQKHYAVTSDDANHQVRCFFQRNRILK